MNRTKLIELGLEQGIHYKEVIKLLGKEYTPSKYVTSEGELPATKPELIKAIARSLGCSYTELNGLEKAPKETIKLLLKLFDPKEYKDLTEP